MYVRLNQRYSLLILFLVNIFMLSFVIFSKDRIEITVISEFDNPDGPDLEDPDLEEGQEPGDSEELQIDSCIGVEEPVLDPRYFTESYNVVWALGKLINHYKSMKTSQC